MSPENFSENSSESALLCEQWQARVRREVWRKSRRLLAKSLLAMPIGVYLLCVGYFLMGPEYYPFDWAVGLGGVIIGTVGGIGFHRWTQSDPDDEAARLIQLQMVPANFGNYRIDSPPPLPDDPLTSVGDSFDPEALSHYEKPREDSVPDSATWPTRNI